METELGVNSNCDDALRRLYPYLDGEVTVYRRFRVRRHLRKCRDCSGAFNFEERLKIVIRERAQEEPPPEFLERLHAYLKDHRPNGSTAD